MRVFAIKSITDNDVYIEANTMIISPTTGIAEFYKEETLVGVVKDYYRIIDNNEIRNYGDFHSPIELKIELK